MLLIEEQRSLIEKYVKANKNFQGNEDLLEDFCSEAFQKSYMIFNSSSNIQKIENYVSKVVHTSILGVLKDSGRVRRTKEGYTATKEVIVPSFEETKVEVSPSSSFSSVVSEASVTSTSPMEPSFVFDFPDPCETPEEILITKDCLQNIADAVCVINNEMPSEQFLEIFYLRYIKGLKQSEISKTINISQSEVCKRLMQLSKYISRFLEGGKS